MNARTLKEYADGKSVAQVCKELNIARSLFYQCLDSGIVVNSVLYRPAGRNN